MRGLIENQGLSLVQFAEDYGIAESQLHNWLKREDPPLAKHWPRLAKFFNVSADYIAAGIPEDIAPMAAPVKPEPEKQEPSVAEESGAFGNSEDVRHQIERHHHELMVAAKNEPTRLGWIREQQLEHLAIPKAWRTHEEINRRAHELAARAQEQRERAQEEQRRRALKHTLRSA